MVKRQNFGSSTLRDSRPPRTNLKPLSKSRSKTLPTLPTSSSSWLTRPHIRPTPIVSSPKKPSAAKNLSSSRSTKLIYAAHCQTTNFAALASLRSSVLAPNITAAFQNYSTRSPRTSPQSPKSQRTTSFASHSSVAQTSARATSLTRWRASSRRLSQTSPAPLVM